MLRKFVQTIVIPGTLTGPIRYVATIPSACTIQKVSMVQSNADGDGRIKMGLSTDDDYFSFYVDMGVSGTPVVLDVAADFRWDTLPHLCAGDILQLYCDHDGSAGTAAQNVTIVITFTEG
jgi:hypothetical protein